MQVLFKKMNIFIYQLGFYIKKIFCLIYLIFFYRINTLDTDFKL